MKLSELETYFYQGREIEFSIKGHNYFLQPFYGDEDAQGKKESRYVLYDCSNPDNISVIFQGSIDTIMNYLFNSEFSFNNNLAAFDFTCIL